MNRFIVIVLDSFGIGAMDDVPPVRPADIGANTCPTILAYGAVDKKKADNILLNLFPDDVVTDTMVPTTCYDTMERLLTENGIHHVGQIFYGSDHTSVACVPGKPSLDKIVEWVKDFSSRYL